MPPRIAVPRQRSHDLSGVLLWQCPHGCGVIVRADATVDGMIDSARVAELHVCPLSAQV